MLNNINKTLVIKFLSLIIIIFLFTPDSTLAGCVGDNIQCERNVWLTTFLVLPFLIYEHLVISVSIFVIILIIVFIIIKRKKRLGVDNSYKKN